MRRCVYKQLKQGRADDAALSKCFKNRFDASETVGTQNAVSLCASIRTSFKRR